jgi:hypothetical protein
MLFPEEIRFSTIKDDPPLQASKWLTSQILIDDDQMADLFTELGEFSIYRAGSVTNIGEGSLSKQQFLSQYQKYIEVLRSGNIPKSEIYRPYFSSIFTVDKSALYAIKIDNDKQLIRISKPVIQLQAHHMDYSLEDGKFRPMILGMDSIAWGVQFSYPQIFQDSKTMQIFNVGVSEDFPNTQLFKKLQRWIRHNTIPTPFLIGDQKMNIPMRLGKKCLPWINRHPTLIKKGLRVRDGS